MKILSVSSYYPPHMGGLEIVAENQAVGLAALGNQVTVVTGSEKGSAHYIKGGVSVIAIRVLGFMEKIGAPFPIFTPTLISTLYRETKKADIVHIHDAFYMSSFVAALIARWHRKPIVLMQHVEMINHPSIIVMLAQKIIYATSGKLVFHLSSVILTLNDRVRDFVLSQGIPEIRLLPIMNGVDTDIFKPIIHSQKIELRKKWGLNLEKPIILFVGRFVPKKGFQKLLDARSSEYQIVFAGGDAPKTNYDDVVFVGKLTQSYLAEIYQAADIFVLPSESEGFPLSIGEAMATGLPVITTNDPGYRRYSFDPDKIILLDAPTSVSVRESIKTLLFDAEKQAIMASYSQEYANTHFKWENIIKVLSHIYTSLIVAQSKSLIVTTSWDDGHILDIELASLLKKYNIAGTFYISPQDHEWDQDNLLTDEQVRLIAKDFEIGAHTMTHRPLPTISPEEARKEIVTSKKYLENIIGKSVVSFCYPRGEYRISHAKMVEEAGYHLARTVKRFQYSIGTKPFEMPTSVHTYDHFLDALHLAYFVRGNPIAFIRLYRNWEKQAIAMFDRLLTKGGVFHLWGHSWEVDGHHDWERLERVLAYISNRPNVQYLSNGQLL